MPRVVLSFLVGGALAVAGVILQDLFLNPLTDPYVTGVSSGAALGATVAIVLGLAGGLWLTGMALIGGLATLLLVWAAARRRGRIDVYVMLLAGVTASYLLSAIITVVMIRANDDLGAILYWLLGSFSGRTWTDVETALVAVPFMIVPLFFTKEMNILLQGEKRALELGVDVERTKVVLVVTAAVLDGGRRLGVGHHRLRGAYHPASRAPAGRTQSPPPAAALDADGGRLAEPGRPPGAHPGGAHRAAGRGGHHVHRRAGVRLSAAAGQARMSGLDTTDVAGGGAAGGPDASRAAAAGSPDACRAAVAASPDASHAAAERPSPIVAVREALFAYDPTTPCSRACRSTWNPATSWGWSDPTAAARARCST